MLVFARWNGNPNYILIPRLTISSIICDIVEKMLYEQLLRSATHHIYSLADLIINPLESLVLVFAAEMPFHTDQSTSLTGSWFISPRQHAVEILLVNMVAISSFLIYVKKSLQNR